MNIFDRFRSLLTKTAAPAPAKPATSAKFVRPLPVPDDPLLAPVDRRKRNRKDARKGTKAVIIDDSATVVAVLRRILRSAGYVTRDAGDAETGLQLIAEDKPDLIFLDIVLPGMNGFGALRVLRKDASTQHIPVIMISGNEHATEQFYANRIGADNFMKKPFSRSEVFAHIESLLDEDAVPRRVGYVAEIIKPDADEPTM
ncbi:MAG: response regulator [Rhodoferax sp.]|nr:response regulator [Rhodoferax sp.]